MAPMDVGVLDEDAEEVAGDDVGEGIPGFLNYLTGPFDGAEIHDREDDGGKDENSRFYSCHVCGDNWLSIRRSDDYGQSKVTFIHQMGVEPILRRIAHLQAEFVVNDRSVDHWEYYLDDDEVGEGEWMNRLEDRRKVLKAICSN